MCTQCHVVAIVCTNTCRIHTCACPCIRQAVSYTNKLLRGDSAHSVWRVHVHGLWIMTLSQCVTSDMSHGVWTVTVTMHSVVASTLPTRYRPGGVHSPLNASLLLNIGLFTICSNSLCGFREYLCIMYTANSANTATVNKITTCTKFIF